MSFATASHAMLFISLGKLAINIFFYFFFYMKREA